MQLNGKMELERDNEGPAYDIFARLLRGLAGTRLAKPGKFRTADGTGYALRCSYKVDPPVLLAELLGSGPHDQGWHISS